VSRRLIALPIFSSALYILTFPNFNQTYMAYFALVPLAIAVQHALPRRAFWLGWLSGTVAYAGILDWIIATFRAAHLSILLASLCLLLLAAYLGLYWGVWAWYLTVIPAKAGIYNKKNLWTPVFTGVTLVVGAAAWVALEFIRTYLFSGFPWALLADSQVNDLPRLQMACITGVYGVSFVLVLANLALATRNKRTIMTTFVAIMALYSGGIWRLRHYPPLTPAHPIKVALLQGNVDQYKKWDKAYVADIERTYEALVVRASRSKPDLVVWPETSVPGYLLQEKPLHEWITKIIRRSRTNHLVGSPLMISERAYNSAISTDPESNIVGEYDKIHLVPFGEVVPFRSFLGGFRFISILNDLGGFTSGERSPVITAGGVPVAINICYEAIFPNLVRQSVLKGGELIANLTNDGWYMKTSAPYQHWAPNVYRAVENGRWVVRADNTGISGIIDPLGHVVQSSGIFETAIVLGNVTPLADTTFYTRHGDLFAWVCLLFCAASLLLYILRLP
jgi:apolipoprotein N-acyltransferase